jgi:hypothetical protein
MDAVVGTFEKWVLNLLSFSLHTNVPWKEKYAVESQILSHLTHIPLLYLQNMTHPSSSPQTIHYVNQNFTMLQSILDLIARKRRPMMNVRVYQSAHCITIVILFVFSYRLNVPYIVATNSVVGCF